jgi:hypothetical protein
MQGLNPRIFSMANRGFYQSIVYFADTLRLQGSLTLRSFSVMITTTP